MPDPSAAKIKPTTAGEQIDRVARYFKRLKKYKVGLPVDTAVSAAHKDLVYAFFLNCYHLKDWIKGDPALRPLGDVEVFINKSRDLRLCADICNASKHFQLTRPRSNENPELGVPELVVGDKRNKLVLRYEIATSSGALDSFDLAERCMRAWSRFLRFNVREGFGFDFELRA